MTNCKEMLKRHPLSVMPELKCKDDSGLHLTFYCLMNLSIMTVEVKVTSAMELITHISAGDLLSQLSPKLFISWGSWEEHSESSQSVPV